MFELVLAVGVLAGTPEAGGAALENAAVRLAVDGQGRLVELCNRRTGTDYAGERPLWRVFYRQGDVLDVEAVAPPSPPKITADARGLAIRYERLAALDGRPLDVRLELRARLKGPGDEVAWSAQVENRQAGITVTELQFPLVGNGRYPADQALIWSAKGGQRYTNPRGVVRASHSLYMAPDQNGIKMSGMYPGISASTNCFVFAGPREGLYLGSHDPSLQPTLHLLRLLGEELDAGFVKYPFLAPGERWASAEFVLAPYSGTWHVAARKYRAWANCWFVPSKVPDWVRDMTGWQRVILKHQYGELLHPYNTISQIARDGLDAGIDTLLIFGWWNAGMDAGYPDYEFDPAQGGRETFVAQVKAAQAMGAKVHMYFNGRLIDKESSFYRSGEASRITIKDLRGNELNESYHFSGNGTTAWQFGRKTFSMACPSAASWQERLRGWADLALGTGVDAVFYDQLGIAEYPCTDPSHGHKVPFVDLNLLRRENLLRLREHIKGRKPDAGFGSEIITDVTATRVDFLHGLTGAAQANGFLEWFRYTYPEVIISDREIRDDTDIPRRVNLTLIRGLRSDVELYRCRGTIADAPEYRAYITQVNALRKKYAELLLAGRYCDTDYIEKPADAVDARSFTQGDRLLVIMTQRDRPEAATAIRVPGYRYERGDGIGAYGLKPAGEKLSVSLGRHAVAVALYSKLPSRSQGAK